MRVESTDPTPEHGQNNDAGTNTQTGAVALTAYILARLNIIRHGNKGDGWAMTLALTKKRNVQPHRRRNHAVGRAISVNTHFYVMRPERVVHSTCRYQYTSVRCT